MIVIVCGAYGALMGEARLPAAIMDAALMHVTPMPVALFPDIAIMKSKIWTMVIF